MLLTGTHPRALDDKKRLTLPRRVREQLGEPTVLYVTPGPERSLWLFTQDSLERQAEKVDLSGGDESRIFRRLYFAQTEAVEVDRAGRILVPDRLMQSAGLSPEVVLIGVRDHLELWDGKRWQEYLERHAAGLDRLSLL
jgi:transcriptional regulator MraZ